MKRLSVSACLVAVAFLAWLQRRIALDKEIGRIDEETQGGGKAGG